jgi:hypothetical protein
MRKEIRLVDKLRQHLFVAPSSCKGNVMRVDNFTDKELAIKKRLEAGFSHWLTDTSMGDIQIIEFLISTFKISRRQAYFDLANIKELLGNVKNAGKEFQRYRLIEQCMEIYKEAKGKQPKDLDAMLGALAILGKYTKLDKDELEDMPWDDLLPPNFEPSADITILDLKPLPNKESRKQMFLKKFYAEEQIQDAITEPDGQH